MTRTTPLEANLRERVAGRVSFDAMSRAPYSSDASNYRQVAIGVVLPRNQRRGRRGGGMRRTRSAGPGAVGGTAMAGQSTNSAVVIDWSRHLNRVLSLDPVRRVAEVQPGCVLDTLRSAAGTHGLTFGPDPATHDHCTLGGMIGNNSCGTHSSPRGAPPTTRISQRSSPQGCGGATSTQA